MKTKQKYETNTAKNPIIIDVIERDPVSQVVREALAKG
jgi:hypothetical protein